MAIDIHEHRLTRVKENLQRLHLHAEVKLGDGRTPQQLCGNKQFDRILLDAPCSTSGVFRRHPDIKWLRRDRDIAELAGLQAKMLAAIWPHLKSRGVMGLRHLLDPAGRKQRTNRRLPATPLRRQVGRNR